jgi:hypothetical protein
LTGVAVLSLSSSVAANSPITYPVSIPLECAQLAEREHVPAVITNRYQALKAHYKLARLNKADLLVVQCKEAVERLKAGAKS